MRQCWLIAWGAALLCGCSDSAPIPLGAERVPPSAATHSLPIARESETAAPEPLIDVDRREPLFGIRIAAERDCDVGVWSHVAEQRSRRMLLLARRRQIHELQEQLDLAEWALLTAPEQSAFIPRLAEQIQLIDRLRDDLRQEGRRLETELKQLGDVESVSSAERR